MGVCVNRSALGRAVSPSLSPLGEPDPLPLEYMPTFPRAHTRHHRLGVTSGDSRSVGHAFLLECVDHAQRPHTSLLLILSEGAFFSLRRVAASEGLAQKEPPVHMCAGRTFYVKERDTHDESCAIVRL